MDRQGSRTGGHHVVIDERRWRAPTCCCPGTSAPRQELMSARHVVDAALRAEDVGAAQGAAERAARARVHRTKPALGERGTPWWEQTPERRQERWEAGLVEG